MRQLIPLVVMSLLWTPACAQESGQEAQPPSSNAAAAPSPQPKKQQPPEVIIATLKQAYAELEAENAALKSKSGQAQQNYHVFYYDEYARKLAQIQLDTFLWQARASEILVWLVVVICLSGIVFSGYQLLKATTLVPGAVEKGEVTKVSVSQPLETTLELSTEQVRLTSSVIGLVVLIISLGYLYLFLNQVYEVKVTGPLTSPLSGEVRP